MPRPDIRKCPKYLLISFSMMVFLAGGLKFVAGVLVYIDSGFFEEEVIDMLNYIESDTMKLGDLARALVLTMIVIGGLLMLAAILGMCAGWKKIKGWLVANIVFHVVLLLAQGIHVGFWVSVRGHKDQWLRGKMQNKLNDYYGPTSTDTTSKGWNRIFIEGHCCGMEGMMADFTSSNWAALVTEKIPATCCYGVDDDSKTTFVNTDCTNTPTQYYTYGCYDKLYDIINTNSLIIIITSGVMAVVQVAAIIAACAVIDNTVQRFWNSSDEPRTTQLRSSKVKPLR